VRQRANDFKRTLTNATCRTQDCDIFAAGHIRGQKVTLQKRNEFILKLFRAGNKVETTTIQRRD
jgi:hypothetical protein